MFASPEWLLLLDLNDLDEALPGPFEYDVNRMEASFTIAAQSIPYDARELLDPFPSDAQMETARNRGTWRPEGGPVEHLP